MAQKSVLPKGNPTKAWKRIRPRIEPFPDALSEKQAKEVVFRMALDYNDQSNNFRSRSSVKHEAFAIAQSARLLAGRLGTVSLDLLFMILRRSTDKKVRAAGLDFLLAPKMEFVKRQDPMEVWRARLSALAEVNERIVDSREVKRRKLPYLKMELVRSCLYLLAACGKNHSLRRGGDAAQIAAAVFELATGNECYASDFDSQIKQLQVYEKSWRCSPGYWEDEIQTYASLIVLGIWPHVHLIESAFPASPRPSTM